MSGSQQRISANRHRHTVPEIIRGLIPMLFKHCNTKRIADDAYPNNAIIGIAVA